VIDPVCATADFSAGLRLLDVAGSEAGVLVDAAAT
jgi:hypothetical protein